VDTLTFIDELVGLLAWPAAVVAVAWAGRGPLLALANRHGGPPAASSGTPDEAATAAERDGAADPDGDARADQAALLGASLAVVLTQFFGAGAWGWWSTAIGVTLLLIVLSYVRISRDQQLGKGRRYGRLVGFAAVVGLCSTVAVAHGVQTLQSGWRAHGTNGRSVEDFCENLGVGAGAKAVDEANQWLPQDKAPHVLHDVRKAAQKQAFEDCLGRYGSTYLGLATLLATLLALGGAFIWSHREPPRERFWWTRSSESRRKNRPAGLAPGEAGMNEGAQVDAITKTYDELAKACLAAFELRDKLLGRIGPGRLTAVQSLPEWTSAGAGNVRPVRPDSCRVCHRDGRTGGRAGRGAEDHQ
jgi:hypothetical protein